VTTRTWILQSNADRVDLAACLAVGGTVAHGVRRFVGDIAVGDRVFLWRARGRTRVAPGIVAFGAVVEPAAIRPLDHPEAARTDTVLRPKLRVRLRVDDVRLTLEEGMIPREDVRRLPEMAGHPIVTSNMGSDFALDEAQVEALMSLWGRRPSSDGGGTPSHSSQE